MPSCRIMSRQSRSNKLLFICNCPTRIRPEFPRRSVDQEQSGPFAIKCNSGTICQIKKSGTSSSRIHLSFLDGAYWKESPDVVSAVCGDLKYALDHKSRLLKDGSIPQPWMLLFFNSNPFASEDIYKKCLTRCINDSMPFECIFVVMPPDDGFMLFCRKKEWY